MKEEYNPDATYAYGDGVRIIPEGVNRLQELCNIALFLLGSNKRFLQITYCERLVTTGFCTVEQALNIVDDWEYGSDGNLTLRIDKG